MELVRFGLLALAVMWALQLVAAWSQMRYYRNVVRQTAQDWHCGFLGVGTSRSRIGPGAVAIVVIDDDSTVRQVLSMSGLSVFARFRALPDFGGGSTGEFRQRLASMPLAPRVKRALDNALDVACRTAQESRAPSLR